MGRHKKAWLPNDTGKVKNHRTGENLPGRIVCWNEYPSGKKAQRQRTFSTITLAKKFRDQHNARLELQQFPDETVPIDLKEAGREFIGGMSTRSNETVRAYMVSISLLGQLIGDPEVHTIGRVEVDKFIAERMEASREATVAKHCRALKVFFGWCVRNHHATENPIALATARPRNNIAAKRPRLTDKQFEAVLEALDTEDRWLAVGIAGTTGLDFWSMVCKLTPTDVDWESRQFIITRAKTGHEFIVPIHDDFFVVLRQRADQIDLDEPFLSGLSHQGGQNYWWRRACRSAGVEWLRLSDLRKYSVRFLADHLGSMEAAKRTHRNPQVTMDHYHQLNPEAPRLISQRVLPGFHTPQLRVTA